MNDGLQTGFDRDLLSLDGALAIVGQDVSDAHENVQIAQEVLKVLKPYAGLPMSMGVLYQIRDQAIRSVESHLRKQNRLTSYPVLIGWARQLRCLFAAVGEVEVRNARSAADSDSTLLAVWKPDPRAGRQSS